MNSREYDLAVAYRIYPLISRDPPIYKNNKLKLSEICLESFKSSIKPLKVKIWALLDNCPDDYTKLFQERFRAEDLEIIHYNGIGNEKTFEEQIKILLNQDCSNYIYFAEDDYFYLPNQFPKMVKFFKKFSDIHFITPYDHLDYYFLPIHNYKSKIILDQDKHWRTVGSTCLTFLTSKKVLKQTKNIFLKYSKQPSFYKKIKLTGIRFLDRFVKNSQNKASDVDVWLSLTKINIFNFIQVLKYKRKYPRLYGIYSRLWKLNWKQVLFGRKWNLWCPIPTIATHMEEEFLAPGIDWERFFETYKKKWNLDSNY
jgi:hypothetical protein